MVITGTPALRPEGQASGDAGTGKTVLALALLLGLAKDRTAQDPVPVRLSAASWPGNQIRDWIHTHLTDTYRFPAREASSIVAANLVLPVIDGLDEMDSDPAPDYTSRASQAPGSHRTLRARRHPLPRHPDLPPGRLPGTGRRGNRARRRRPGGPGPG